VSKDARELPMLREIDLRGTPIIWLVDLIRPQKVLGSYGSEM
jgi:hypothetical protein